MKKGLIGKKIGMTQLFDENGKVIPVTVVEAGPCTVVQKKTVENDGYAAVQVGYGDVKITRVNKPEAGHFKKANVAPKKVLREFRLEDTDALNVGDVLKADVFAAGDRVDVVGTSKGKGFSGAIKRYGYTIGPKGHGSGYHRGAGSYATNGRTNNRIHLGKKSAGHHGNDTTTILNLLVVGVDVERNALLVKGAIPGPKKSIVVVRSAIKEQRKSRVAKTLVDNTK